MKVRTITDIELKFNITAMKAKLRITEPEDDDIFNEIIKTVEDIASPKIVFGEAYLTDRFENGVSIDGNKFGSMLMKKNLTEVNRVFPFTATCGRELYDWGKTIDDIFVQYWADHIMEVVLRHTIAVLYDTIKTQYGVSKLSSMNPGSLEGWPIEQQKILFSLLQNKQKEIGVELTESYLMVPQKSVSGILFKSKSGYTNCKLCEMVNCPSRSVEFEPGLREKLTGK
ncbi:MAG: vitamin B12 dependent methionine synthase [Clostridiales bacterium]|nr:vitamin B12 dependent methionine synthase [Clostridiales bacterium]